MYKVMGFEGASDSRNRSCATMEAERMSSTGPLRQIMRSVRSLEKMSAKQKLVKEFRLSKRALCTCSPSSALDMC